MGNIFLLFLPAGPSHCLFGYCPQWGSVSGDLAADFTGWSPMDLMMGQLWAHTVLATVFSGGISGLIY